MACALYGYWQISGLLGEGGYWLTKALERFPEAGRERALALVNRGFLRSFQGDIAGSLADCEEGTAIGPRDRRRRRSSPAATSTCT